MKTEKFVSKIYNEEDGRVRSYTIDYPNSGLNLEMLTALFSMGVFQINLLPPEKGSDQPKKVRMLVRASSISAVLTFLNK